MDLQQRLELLSEASQYDLACACGTGDQDRRHRSEADRWVYPVTLPRGGKAIMLKLLASNACSNDCAYCPFRAGHDSRRTELLPDEVARTFLDYHRRQNLYGLFLSSGVPGTPDQAMQRLVDSARLLRRRGYRGYIHLKVLPGCSDAALESALAVASAVSVNVESPTARAFSRLSQRKNYARDIVRPLKRIAELTARGGPFARVKQTTQFVVGASDETDRELVLATAGLYRNLKLNRVYFSAYQRGLGAGDLPGERPAPDEQPGDILTREHRLYQVDFLLRQYKWQPDDILFERDRLSLTVDPKQAWADAHPEVYPVKLLKADKHDLLRVPGLGPRTAKKILTARKEGPLRSLAQVGLKGKRLEQVERYTVLS